MKRSKGEKRVNGKGKGERGDERDGVYLIFGKEVIFELAVKVESVDHVG